MVYDTKSMRRRLRWQYLNRKYWRLWNEGVKKVAAAERIKRRAHEHGISYVPTAIFISDGEPVLQKIDRIKKSTYKSEIYERQGMHENIFRKKFRDHDWQK